MLFHGPVRVPDKIAAGTATITLSFDAWKGVAVRPTTHSVPVLPPKYIPKTEPVAPNLIASLPLNPPRGGRWKLAFSPDGARLLASCYPFGVVHIWDLASGMEIHRIAPPPGYGESGDYSAYDYSVLSPDGKTLYIPTARRTVRPIERDGKKSYRVEYAGFIRVWDLDSEKEKEKHWPSDGAAPWHVRIDPSGRFLVYVERLGDERAASIGVTERTMVWDVVRHLRWKLCDGSAIPMFAEDGQTGLSFGPKSKTVIAAFNQYRSKTSEIRILDVLMGKQLARLDSPNKGRYFSVCPIAPEDAVVAVYLSGKEGEQEAVWFLDARTLQERGKLHLGYADPEQYGSGGGPFGQFTPDGKRFIALGDGDAFVWNVASRKVERTFRVGDWFRRQLAISPDGRTVAIAWMPRDRDLESELQSGQRVDIKEFPQPRVSLIDLTGNVPTRALVAPHGHVCGVAFSPDGKTLAIEGGDAVHLFDLRK